MSGQDSWFPGRDLYSTMDLSGRRKNSSESRATFAVYIRIGQQIICIECNFVTKELWNRRRIVLIRRRVPLVFPALKQNPGVYRFKHAGEVEIVASRRLITQDTDFCQQATETVLLR